MTSLRQSISDTISISTEDLDFVLSLFVPKNLSKNDHFLQIGTKCNEVAYIKSGVLRLFRLEQNGEESTHYFPPQNTFVTSHTSLNSQTASTEGIQAVTASELLVISKQNLEIMYKKVPTMQDFGRKATETIVTEMNKRVSILMGIRSIIYFLLKELIFISFWILLIIF